MKVVFIRHLQTPGNEKRQYIGRTDEELSARAVAAFRQKVPQNAHQKVPQNDPQAGRMYPPVQYVVASPMRRCIGTARLIYPGQEVITEPLLRECDFGAYEGKTYEELKDEPAYIRWLASGGMSPFPDGEDPAAFRRRCVEGVKQRVLWLLDKGADSAAFVVHGGTVMAALSELAETDRPAGGAENFYRWQVENGCGYAGEVRREDWQNGRTVIRNIREIGRSCIEY